MLLIAADCCLCWPFFKRCEQIRSLFCRTTALCVITFGHSPQQCCKGKLVILEAFLFTDRGHVLQSVPVFWRVYESIPYIEWTMHLKRSCQAGFKRLCDASLQPSSRSEGFGGHAATCWDPVAWPWLQHVDSRLSEALQESNKARYRTGRVPLCQCVGALGRHAWRHSLVALLPQIGLVGSLWDSNDRFWTW